MGIVCKGFDGVLTEYDWAQMSGLMGNMPSVKGPDDFRVGTTVQGHSVVFGPAGAGLGSRGDVHVE